MGTTLNQIKEEFFNDMGHPYVTVELTDDQFDSAVKTAKRWFISKKGFQVFRPMPIVEGQSEYKMNSDVSQVLDVIFQVPSDVSAFFTLGFFDIIPYGPNTFMNMGSGLSNYSGFVQLLQYTETRKRVFSVDPDWQYDQQNRILRITTRMGNPSGIMIVNAKLTDFDPSKLGDKDDDLFVRYLKACLKKTVGRIRSKYDQLPAANGPVALDGKDLLAEAKEEMEALDSLIFSSQGPDIPMLA